MSAVLSHPTLDDLIDRLTAEGLIGMHAAARLLGRHQATVGRWLLDGVTLPDGRHVQLEGFRLGGKLQTSRAAITRFIVAQQDAPTAEPITTPAARRRVDAEAERVLDAAGIR